MRDAEPWLKFVVAGGQGFYGDTPTAVDALARRRRRLPLPRSARRADARDPAEGSPARRVARLHARSPRVPRARVAVRRRRAHEGDHERRRHQPDRGRARRDRDRAQAGRDAASRSRPCVGDDVLGAARRAARRARLSRSRTSTPASRSTTFPGQPLFASAYLGARPIVDALAQGADIVITGRVADASLFLAPLVYEHGWSWDDWDRLAAGILVGHLLECSGQSLGGNYSGDWWALPHPWDLPYPIASVDADGTAVISKPAGSGRPRVDRHAAPPAALRGARPARATSRPTSSPTSRPRTSRISPDDRVRITGVRGTPGDRHVQAAARVARGLGGRGARRVLVARRVREGEGHRRDPAQARRDGRPRGRRVARRVLGRRRARRPDGAARPTHEPPECVLRVAWRCADQRTAGLVGRELVPLTLSAPPAGMTGAGRGAGGATELLSIWPTLVDKAVVDAEVRVVLAGGEVAMARLALRELCGYRAGDKGDIANVAHLRRRRRDVRADRARGDRGAGEGALRRDGARPRRPLRGRQRARAQLRHAGRARWRRTENAARRQPRQDARRRARPPGDRRPRRDGRPPSRPPRRRRGPTRSSVAERATER